MYERYECGPKSAARLKRLPWMRLVPWRRYYLCKECGRRMFVPSPHVRLGWRRQIKRILAVALVILAVAAVTFKVLEEASTVRKGCVDECF